MGKSYYELLKHPKWQEKRLKIMERFGFQCENCGEKEVTLNVHHGYYEKGLSPWDYPDNSLYSLCENCHENAEKSKIFINRIIGKLGYHNSRLLGYVIGLYFSGLYYSDNDDEESIIINNDDLPIDTCFHSLSEGISDCLNIDPERVFDSIVKNSKIDSELLE